VKNIRRIFVITILASLFLFISCDKSVTASDYDEKIMPLAVGNTWSYETHGIVNNIKYDNTMTIAGSTERNDKQWYYFFEENHEAFMVRNDENGLWVYEEEGEELLWKYPVKKNETYCDVCNDDGTSLKITCIGKNIKYDQYEGCIVYNVCENGNLIHRYYLSPNIGLVGWEFYMNGYFIEESKLISYAIL
jgi:hypothetical protein